MTAELAADGPGTRLTLTHSRLPVSAAVGYGAGWQTYFEQLAADLADEKAHGAAWDRRWEELRPAYQAQADALGPV